VHRLICRRSPRKSGSVSPTAAKSLDFSGEIVHCDLARSRTCALAFEEVSAEESLRVFHLKIEMLLISVSWPPALFHETAARACGSARHNTCVYQFKIGDRSAACQV